MTTDDLWGPSEDSSDFNPPEMPEIPPGAQAIMIQGNPEKKSRVLKQYARIAGRPQTIKFAQIITERLSELNEMGGKEVPDEAMGTFGLVAAQYNFHGETIKMVAKFEVDEAVEQALPEGLLEIVQNATNLPEAMTALCEIFFSMGYSFALDGTLATEKAEDESD